MPTKTVKFTNKITIILRVDGKTTIGYNQKHRVSVYGTFEDPKEAFMAATVLNNLIAPYDDLIKRLFTYKDFLLRIGAYKELREQVENEQVIIAKNVLKGIKD